MKDTILFEHRRLNVVERELDNGIKWVFSSIPWCKSQGVAILPYKVIETNPARNEKTKRYLGRFEICPAHSPKGKLGAVTGGMDVVGETPAQTAVREMYEETGYIIKTNDLISLGEVRPSKGSDTTMYLFAVDVTRKDKGKPIGDGSLIESLASCQWMNRNEAIFCADPLVATMIARLGVMD